MIQGNKIGTNAAGTVAIPNGSGIYIDDVSGFLIGGTAAGAGNLISGNVGGAIAIGSTSGGAIEGNDIGTDVTGTLAIPNATAVPAGYVIGLGNGASNVTIGGTTVAARNVISGNDAGGILISDGVIDNAGNGVPFNDGVNEDNTVEGNYIGINALGDALPNLGSGIDVATTALSTVIGGTAAGAGNVISGNAGNGVVIDGTGVPAETPLYLKADGNTNNSSFSPGQPVGGATLVGGVTYGTGVTGQAFEFNDTPGERVVVTDSGYLASYALTLSAWINLNSLPGATPYVIASLGYSATSENYGLYVNSSGELVFEWYSAGAFHTETSSGADLGSRLGVFQQVAVVTDGSTVTFYLNGAAVGSSALPDPLDESFSGNLEIGGLSQGPNLFNGLIDELSITTDPLPADVIAQIYANAGQGTDLGGSGTQDTTVAGNWIGTNRDGTAAVGNAGDGVYLNQTQNATIGGTVAGAGNLISGNATGVEINDASSVYVQGNLIGTDWTGTLPLGNSGAGVLVDGGSAAVTIGGPVGGARNVISDNAEGIEITGAATTGTDIAGNLIGTDITGQSALGNLSAGVTVSGASGTTIGGLTSLAQNVISGNAGDGIDLSGGATDTLIENNYIGVDQTGTQPVGNQGSGLSVSGATGVSIGGTLHGSGNVISANAQSGVSIGGGSSTGIIVVGNFIGTDYTGTNAVGNLGDGVAISDPPGVTIGGTVTGSQNIISANTGAGIALLDDADNELIEGNLIGTDVTARTRWATAPASWSTAVRRTTRSAGRPRARAIRLPISAGIGVDVDTTAGTGNAIRLNSIFANSGLGIQLGSGVTSNAPGGPHTGPNELQNYPVITGLTNGGGTTTITGTFNSTPSTTFALDFYALSVANASGYGEGRYVLGSRSGDD